MQIGVNLMVWRLAFRTEDFPLLAWCQRLGVAGVEIPLHLPLQFDPQRLRAELRDLGLGCTATTHLPQGCSLLRDDERPRGIAALRQAIAAASALGATLLSGPVCAPVGEFSGAGPTRREWDSAVSGLRTVAQVAADYGVVVNLEPLNRFETYFLTTTADAVRLVEEVGSTSLGLLLDTFHMNIEEKSLPHAIRQAGRWLQHVHCAENDRGIVGSGHIDWPGVISVLRELGYQGWLTVESFAQPAADFVAAAIWRPLAASPEELVGQSVRYLQTLVRQRPEDPREDRRQ